MFAVEVEGMCPVADNRIVLEACRIVFTSTSFAAMEEALLLGKMGSKVLYCPHRKKLVTISDTAIEAFKYENFVIRSNIVLMFIRLAVATRHTEPI